MSATMIGERTPARTRPASPRAVVAALATAESRRHLRSPLLWVGVALSGAFAWVTMDQPDDWAGARYQAAPILVGPLLLVISIAVAGSFHRERLGVSEEAPVGEALRSTGRLVGALAPVAVVAVLTAAGAIWVRQQGGLDIGEEPGRTLHAQFTLPELLQPVVLALLAVAVGAAAGRRLRHRATSTLLLFVGWFPVVLVYWGFQSRQVIPLSIVQTQPVSLPVGPISANPLDFPASWLLTQPGEYQDHWARQFVSGLLAAGHDVWLLGLTCLFLAVALPRHRRPVLLGLGTLLAAGGLALQYAVIP
ncbi:MAG: hypothetical protein ABWX84_02985 [Nocardioides sp.]